MTGRNRASTILRPVATSFCAASGDCLPGIPSTQIMWTAGIHASINNIVATLNCSNGQAELRADANGVSTSLERVSVNSTSGVPRLLLIDHTRIGDGTATGEIKANLLGDWPPNRIAQIFQVGSSQIGFSQHGRIGRFGVRAEGGSPPALVKNVIDFDPEVILYRPVPDTDVLHAVAMDLIERSDRPLISWIMDDWPTFARRENRPGIADLEEDWRWILSRSSLRLSISESMSSEFSIRYGGHFVPVANAVDPAEWPILEKPAVPFRVRYSGSLQPEMALGGLIRIAGAVERLGRGGHDIKFEISTRKYWYDRYSQYLSQFTRTSVSVGNLTKAEYRKWLGSAHANVIVYNFDDLSRSYIRFSLANKLPECMISGAALLAHGPADVATMKYLDEVDCGVRIKEPSEDKLVDALKTLITDSEYSEATAAKAREIAIQNHGLAEARQKLADLVSSAAGTSVPEVPQSPRALRHLRVGVGTKPEGSTEPDAGWGPRWLDIAYHLRDRSTRRMIRYLTAGLSVGALIFSAAGALHISLVLGLIALGVFSLPRIAREAITIQRARSEQEPGSYSFSKLWLDIAHSLRDRSTRRLIRYLTVGLSVCALIVGAFGALHIALIIGLTALGVFSLPRIARQVITAQRMRSGLELASCQPSTLQTVPIDRDGKAQCDEVRIVYEVMKRRTQPQMSRIMIDVGAHWGASLKRFAEDGWKVFAFEPDPANREKLMGATKGVPHVVLSAEAVSDTTGTVVPFFASEESTGISGLSAFRDTHRKVAEVTTVTLNDVVGRHGIPHIDFLKIDVEGFEKAVLDGLDFGKMRPSCVVAEYEDAKTESLGYGVHDLARFLTDRGYSVFVSEWHPIERYGIQHSWRRIFEYPGEVLTGSWGNLVAFLDKPPPNMLSEAVIAATDRRIVFVGDEERTSAAKVTPAAG